MDLEIAPEIFSVYFQSIGGIIDAHGDGIFEFFQIPLFGSENKSVMKEADLSLIEYHTVFDVRGHELSVFELSYDLPHKIGEQVAPTPKLFRFFCIG